MYFVIMKRTAKQTWTQKSKYTHTLIPMHAHAQWWLNQLNYAVWDKQKGIQMEATTERQQIITEELFESQVSKQEGVFRGRLTEGFQCIYCACKLSYNSVPTCFGECAR